MLHYQQTAIVFKLKTLNFAALEQDRETENPVKSSAIAVKSTAKKVVQHTFHSPASNPYFRVISSAELVSFSFSFSFSLVFSLVAEQETTKLRLREDKW